MLRASRLRLSTWIAGVLLVGVSAAHGTTVVPVTVEALATRADDVVIGAVRTSHSFWLGRTIVTDHEVDVQTSLRGSLTPRSTIVVRLPGGNVGRIGQTVPGVPTPVAGVPAVWFLTRAANVPNVWYLTHLTASILSLATDASGTVRVLPAREGMIVAGVPGGSSALGAGPSRAPASTTATATAPASTTAPATATATATTTVTSAAGASVTVMAARGVDLDLFVRTVRGRP